MTQLELDDENWGVNQFGMPPLVIVFSNGTRLFASQDEAGSGPGVLIGIDDRGPFQLGAEAVVTN